MANDYPKIPGSWIDSDELALSLAGLEDLTTSRTMDQDKSQPPTPDGTGRPANFQIIAPLLYRSSYPAYAHFEKLQELNLKTIITLVDVPMDQQYTDWISRLKITHHEIKIIANKDETVFTDKEAVHKVLDVILDPQNYPLLIHCNKGKHRTGCMTACFRKVCGWSDEACIEEYEKFSKPKDRPLDKIFIRNFDPEPLKAKAYENGFYAQVYRHPSVKTSDYTTSTAMTADTTSTALTADTFAPTSAESDSAGDWFEINHKEADQKRAEIMSKYNLRRGTDV